MTCKKPSCIKEIYPHCHNHLQFPLGVIWHWVIVLISHALWLQHVASASIQGKQGMVQLHVFIWGES